MKSQPKPRRSRRALAHQEVGLLDCLDRLDPLDLHDQCAGVERGEKFEEVERADLAGRPHGRFKAESGFSDASSFLLAIEVALAYPYGLKGDGYENGRR